MLKIFGSKYNGAERGIRACARVGAYRHCTSVYCLNLTFSALHGNFFVRLKVNRAKNRREKKKIHPNKAKQIEGDAFHTLSRRP